MSVNTVLTLEDVLNKRDESKVNELANPDKKIKKEPKVIIPRGKPKSGRPWKTEKQRFKSIKKTRGIQLSNKLKNQLKLRDDLIRVKTISRAREQDRIEAKELKKQRRRENLARRKQNEMKSEVVQVIKNPSKIKKMNRRQLRSIEKRDTTKIHKK